jgi:hypothetical protein
MHAKCRSIRMWAVQGQRWGRVPRNWPLADGPPRQTNQRRLGWLKLPFSATYSVVAM